MTAFASDHLTLICLVENRHLESHTTLAFEPPEGRIFAASDFCSGYGNLKNYIEPVKIDAVTLELLSLLNF